VIILAHRGAPSIRRPENTVAAVAAALDGPADGVEIDVRRCADGVLVCSHDADLMRLSGRQLDVAGNTSGEIRGVALAGGHHTPTLDEVLAAAGRSGRGRLVIEAKPVPDTAAAMATARSLCATLDGATFGLDVTVSSFDAMLLRVVRSALRHTGHGAIRTALLGEPADATDALLRRTLDGGHDELHPHLGSLLRDPHLVGVAHSLGASVTCWTVNRRKDVRRLAQLGVDAVISDRPGAARSAVRSMAAVPVYGSNL
jgi:glycerophosphoryl diester phosphodiesterase